MRFFADRSEGHGTSRETLDDFFRRFNLFYGHRLARLLDFHQATQRGQVAALSIDQCGIFFKALKVLLADTVLQFADGVGIQQVIFAVYPEVIAAATVSSVSASVTVRKANSCLSWASRARTSSPTPPILEAVPAKYALTRSSLSPMASKTCAPR